MVFGLSYRFFLSIVKTYGFQIVILNGFKLIIINGFEVDISHSLQVVTYDFQAVASKLMVSWL